MGSGTVTLNRAIFDLNGKTLVCNTMDFGTGAISRSLVFGTGTLNCNLFNGGSGTNYTVSAGSGTLTMTGGGAQVSTISSVSLPPPTYIITPALGVGLTMNMSGGTVASLVVSGAGLSLASNLVVTGTLSVTSELGLSAFSIPSLKSSVGGTQRTLTVNGKFETSNYCPIVDINAVTRLHSYVGNDGGNNTNIVFNKLLGVQSLLGVGM